MQNLGNKIIIIGLVILVIFIVGGGILAKKKGWIGGEEGLKVAVEKAQKRTMDWLNRLKLAEMQKASLPN
jgi:hypothetical protein